MTSEDDARNRWLVIQAMRLGGVAMVVVGILMINGMIPAPAVAGYVLAGVGLIDVFVIPTLLARKWRTPPK